MAPERERVEPPNALGARDNHAGPEAEVLFRAQFAMRVVVALLCADWGATGGDG